MGGGLMQLVAYGAQDIYLTGNPQITFFKVVYRRHTNFAMEAIEQTWNGSQTANGRCTATISRNGDLVSKMYLELVGTNVADFNNPTAAGISSVELEIGGQRIDKHSGKWMEVWAELTQPNECGATAAATTANLPVDGTAFQAMSGMGGMVASGVANTFFVPLQFWFNRNPGLALPLIALQYHEVKVILDHNFTAAFTATSNKLWCDYIYLDTDERRRFAQVSHEYLIEQVQEQSLSAASGNHDLNFNHPVKELIWTASTDTTGGDGGTDWATLVPPSAAITDTFGLKLNGHDRFAARDLRYFSRVQVHDYHTGIGGLDSNTAAALGQFNDSICVYSFALKPEEHQPSGTCNFSRIDNAQLVASGVLSEFAYIYAVNYNVLRIMSGMGGLAYSN
jgi:hypothetical protein